MLAHFINNAGTVIQAQLFGADWIREELNNSSAWDSADYGIAAACAVGLGMTWWAMRRLASWPNQAARYVSEVS